jgi:curli biogenesis system outer membrane secretion channel CsgG
MKSRTVTAIAVFLTLVSAAGAQQKKRVAVIDFDYATVQSQVSSMFGTNKDVGKGIVDLLVDKLVSDGVFSVIERNALDKIIAEQNFSNSERADPNSASKIGRILGVDAIIVGSITQFGRDDKSTSVGGGAIGNVTGRFGIGGVNKTSSNAVVQITSRIINTTTGEILASVTAKGQSTRSGTGLLGAGGSVYGPEAGLGINMRSSNFANTILGEAITKCVADLGSQLDSKAAALPTNVVQVSGLIADVSPDGTIIINVGSRAGVKVGDRLDIKREGRVIRDPATGKALRSIGDAVGSLTITEVDDGSAVGKFVGGGGPAKVGDAVSTAK